MIVLVVATAFFGSVSASAYPVNPPPWRPPIWVPPRARQLPVEAPECKDVVQLNSGANGPQADVAIPFDGESEQVINVVADVPGQAVTAVEPIDDAVLNDSPGENALKARFFLARQNTPDISAIEVNGKTVCQDDRPKSRSGSTGVAYKFRFNV